MGLLDVTPVSPMKSEISKAPRIYEKPTDPKAKIPRPKKLDRATLNALRSVYNALCKTYKKLLKQHENTPFVDLPPRVRDFKIVEEFLGRQS